MRMLTSLTVAVIGVGLIAGAPAWAAAKKITVKMSAKDEVPQPNDLKATGEADLTFDDATKQLTWKITAKDLSGDPVAAHLHGPAEAGAAAGVLVNLTPNGAKLPIEGSATLTDEQVKDLMEGKTYVNVHTVANKAGELRGQVKP